MLAMRRLLRYGYVYVCRLVLPLYSYVLFVLNRLVFVFICLFFVRFVSFPKLFVSLRLCFNLSVFVFRFSFRFHASLKLHMVQRFHVDFGSWWQNIKNYSEVCANCSKVLWGCLIAITEKRSWLHHRFGTKMWNAPVPWWILIMMTENYLLWSGMCQNVEGRYCRHRDDIRSSCQKK